MRENEARQEDDHDPDSKRPASNAKDFIQIILGNQPLGLRNSG